MSGDTLSGRPERAQRVEGPHPRMVRLGEVLSASGPKVQDAGDYPVYSVTKHAGFVPSLEFFNKQVFSRDLTGYRLVHAGEFAYATIHLDEGSIGIAPEDALISPMYTVFSIDENRVNRHYLLYLLKSPWALTMYSVLGRGAIHRRMAISFKALCGLRIPLPPLPEQRRIVSILDRADAIRAKRRQVLSDLDELPRSLFTEMFGDPVSNVRGWKCLFLSELGTVERGVSKFRPRNAPELLGGSYPLIQTGDVTRAGLYIRDYSSTYSELGLSQSRIWKKGTLCITIAANIAQTAILDFDACFPDSVVGFISNDQTNNLFIHYWFTFFQKILEQQAPESAQKNINLKILSHLKVITPPISLQREFASRVERIDAIRAKVAEALKLDDELFASLQSRAFRGEL